MATLGLPRSAYVPYVETSIRVFTYWINQIIRLRLEATGPRPQFLKRYYG